MYSLCIILYGVLPYIRRNLSGLYERFERLQTIPLRQIRHPVGFIHKNFVGCATVLVESSPTPFSPLPSLLPLPSSFPILPSPFFLYSPLTLCFLLSPFFCYLSLLISRPPPHKCERYFKLQSRPNPQIKLKKPPPTTIRSPHRVFATPHRPNGLRGCATIIWTRDNPPKSPPSLRVRQRSREPVMGRCSTPEAGSV